LNIIEILELVCPEGKTKYIETLLRVMKKTKNFNNYITEIRDLLKNRLKVSDSKLDNFTDFQVFFMWRFLDTSFDINDLVEYQKFCEFNERGLIELNDLSRYSSFDEILSVTAIAELKSQEKELEKQIKVVYSTEEWMVIRPLTYHSSLKYGASTKWCTASDSNPDYFLRYSKRGILLYMINKVTGLKVACFKSLNSEPEFSFWNQTDIRIDSIESGLPLFIIDVIRDEVTNNPIPNISLLSNEDRLIQENLVRSKMKSIELSNEEPIADMRDMGLEPDIIRNYENEAIMDARDEDGGVEEMEMESEPMERAEVHHEVESISNLLNNMGNRLRNTDGIQQEPETVGDVPRINRF
jgi:hypothetical protein